MSMNTKLKAVICITPAAMKVASHEMIAACTAEARQSQCYRNLIILIISYRIQLMTHDSAAAFLLKIYCCLNGSGERRM